MKMKAKIIIAAAIAISMAACNKEENAETPTGKTVTVTAGIKQKEETRIAFKEDGEQTKVVWAADDIFSICYAGGSDTKRYIFQLTEGANTTSGTFASQWNGEFAVPEAKIYAAYLGNLSLPSNLPNLDTYFTSQNGTGTDFHIMAATFDNTTEQKTNWEDIDFKFENKTAILEITLKIPGAAKQQVTNIKVSAPGLVSSAKYTFDDGTWTGVEKNATITISPNPTAGDDDTFTLRINQPPLGAATGAITINATCDSKNYTATLGSGAFTQANIYKTTADMYEAGEVMRFTIETTEQNQTFTLPFFGSNTPVDLTVDWGNGNANPILAGTEPNHTYTKHTYTTANTYTITLSTNTPATDVQMPRWNFANNYTGATLLKSMDTPMLRMAGTDLSACFYDCTNLETIHPALFAKNTTATSFYECFYSCTSLKEIPNGLFHGLTVAINFRGCFYNCSKAKVNPNIFCNDATEKDTRFAGKPMDFAFCFENVGSGLEAGQAGTAPRLWKYEFAGTNYSGCFTGCTNVTNWDDIPKTWGGPKE